MRHIGKRPWSCIVALLLSACGGGTPAPAAAPVEVPVSVNAQPTPAPLAMFVHGGGWVQGEPSDAALLVPAFASWGAVLETATYRFIPAVALADEITDVRAEVARVRKSSTQPMVVIGHSTGAHLAAAAVLGADDGKPVCLVLLDGVGLDLPKMLREQRGVQVRLSLTPEQAVPYSPMAMIDAKDRVRAFIATGDDARGTRALGEAFALALQGQGLSAEYHYYAGMTHEQFRTEFRDAPQGPLVSDLHRFVQGCAAGTAVM